MEKPLYQAGSLMLSLLYRKRTIVRYPLFMLLLMLLLCVMTSYVVMGIENAIYKLP